ncbi:MAG: hypothetical protein Q7U63_12105 [Polaromonas sp.]|uniref:hypothetical protein n=1 Tax=Polaromonas sp. TaxID=1869339 RepID=UPI00271C6794|nr:hypothetical protein [Polaromonas sp.]MDO9114520.1 hypothetical protein [Polaromonas sp.]
MLKVLEFLVYLGAMLGGVFLFGSAALGNWGNGARYAALWCKSVLGMAAVGAVIGWLVIQFMPLPPA